MFVLSRFGFNEMMKCRSRLRGLFDREPASVEEGAQRVVEFFHREFVDEAGEPACALVRIFKTHPYAELDEELQSFARGVVPEVETIADARCLVLMATHGDRPEWCSRHSSEGHRAIPLTSEDMIEKAPMIAQLFKQFGVPISSILRPNPTLLLDLRDTTFNIFHVQQAFGSPYIVAQGEFVEPFGIQSVLGFGGMLSSGDLFAAIMFTKVSVSSEVADHFKVIGLNLKLAMLPIARKSLFTAQ